MRTPLTFLPLLVIGTMLFGLAPATAAPATPQQTILSPVIAKKAVYPKIVIYTVAWCPHCRELKEYLSTRAIPFVNKDVETDATAMEELTQKYKSQGVPVVVFGNDQGILKGFTAESFEKAAARVLASDNK